MAILLFWLHECSVVVRLRGRCAGWICSGVKVKHFYFHLQGINSIVWQHAHFNPSLVTSGKDLYDMLLIFHFKICWNNHYPDVASEYYLIQNCNYNELLNFIYLIMMVKLFNKKTTSDLSEYISMPKCQELSKE